MTIDMILRDVMCHSETEQKCKLLLLNKNTLSNYIMKYELQRDNMKGIKNMFNKILDNMKNNDISYEMIDIMSHTIVQIDENLSYLNDVMTNNICNVCRYIEGLLIDDIYCVSNIEKICKIIIGTKISFRSVKNCDFFRTPDIYVQYKKEIYKIMNYYSKRFEDGAIYKKYMVCMCGIYIMYTMASFLLILMFFFTIKNIPECILTIPILWVILFAWHILKLYVIYKWRNNKIPYYQHFQSKFINTVEYILTMIDIIVSMPHIIPIVFIEKMFSKHKKYSDIASEFEYYKYKSFDMSLIRKIDIV